MKWLRTYIIMIGIASFLIIYSQQLSELYVGSFLGNIAYPLLTYSSAAFTFYEPFTILGYQNREQFERRIVFLKDDFNRKFVLKCYSDDQKGEAISEYLGSFIGTSVNIPINKVKIIVGGELLTRIDNATYFATLHTHVPGKELCKWYETPPNDIILKGGLISYRHLNCLMLSDDLCDIQSLDIFLNNKDRHHENCFFDENTMRYYAIDMGDIFLAARNFPNSECELADDVYQELSNMVAQEKIVAYDTYQFLTAVDVPISCEQKKALQRMSVTLENLVILYPIETLLVMWLSIAQEVDFVYTEYKKTYMRLLFEQNMYWVHKVIDRINELVLIQDQ